jgi:hypothetical protein
MSEATDESALVVGHGPAVGVTFHPVERQVVKTCLQLGFDTWWQRVEIWSNHITALSE